MKRAKCQGGLFAPRFEARRGRVSQRENRPVKWPAAAHTRRRRVADGPTFDPGDALAEAASASTQRCYRISYP